jgi:hypothetical protein
MIKKTNNIDNLLVRVGHLLLEEQLQFISSQLITHLML